LLATLLNKLKISGLCLAMINVSCILRAYCVASRI